MISNIRPAVVTFAMLVMAGCQTASLEDAAPKAATANTLQVGAAAPAGSEVVVATGAAPTPIAPSAPTVIRRNPGFTSVVPIEKTAPVENKEFVAQGANRTGQYPTFGRIPSTANAQLSSAEKSAAEAEIAELLRSRAATPDARAQYELRLLQLRALAASHGSDTQRKIEN